MNEAVEKMYTAVWPWFSLDAKGTKPIKNWGDEPQSRIDQCLQCPYPEGCRNCVEKAHNKAKRKRAKVRTAQLQIEGMGV